MSNTELSASFNDAFDEDIEDVEAEDIEVDETEAETPENPEPEAPQAEETPEPLEPPEYFTAEQKEAFKQIQDRAVQEAWANQYTEHQSYIGQRQQEIADAKRNLEMYQQYQQALEPINPILQKYGQSPAMAIAQMAHYRQMLEVDPVSLIKEVAQERGIDLNQLVEEQPYIDPHVSQELQTLKQQNQQLQQAIGQFQQGQQNQSAQAIQAEIEAFATAKDDSGQPAYPYFEKAVNDMAVLLQMPNNNINDLQSAYEYATKYNPEIQKEIQAKAEKEKAAARQAEAQKAKEASVRTNSKTKDAPAPKVTLNDIFDGDD